MRPCVRSIEVGSIFNDWAERGVNLIQEFNQKRMPSGEQLYFLHQVATDYRPKLSRRQSRWLLHANDFDAT